MYSWSAATAAETGKQAMKYIGKILWLVFFLVLFLFAVLQLILGNCGIIGFGIAMVIVVPGIVKNAFGLYRDIVDQRNWLNYQMHQKPDP